MAQTCLDENMLTTISAQDKANSKLTDNYQDRFSSSIAQY